MTDHRIRPDIVLALRIETANDYPLQRAEEAAHAKLHAIYGSGNVLDKEAIVKAAFESIDTDELRDVISGWLIGTGYYSVEISIDEAQNIAQAVKNWLTGKEN